MGSQKKQGIVAVLEREGRFLLGKRSLHKEAGAGYWCPISGKIEPGESEEAALVREVAEESGLLVEPERKICEIDTRDGRTRLHWWRARILGSPLVRRNEEHSELRWVTLEEMRALQPFFEEDLAIFEALHEAR